tara:strand:- start:10 stop:1470 length:1461 start_codon:yes stop_codon:yes gene_type:complete
MGARRAKFASNLINAQQVERVAESYACQFESEDLKLWWRRNFRRYLSNQETLISEITDFQHLAELYSRGTLSPPVSAWAVRDIRDGRAVHLFDAEGVDAGRLNAGPIATLISWMRAQKPADRHRQRLNRISVPEALKLARTWQLTENRRNERQIVERPDDTHCVWSFDDGYRIVHLDTVTAFLRESKLLRNCLHDVDRFLGSEVLSLRDPDNHPHAAIEFRNDLLIQVRGFANSALRQKYHPYLLAYLTDRGVPESEIIARLGLIDFNGEAHLDIDHCVQAFSNWVVTLQYPDEVPFMHHKTIREFLNIYARYGKSARAKTREVVISHFKPRRRFLRNRLASEKRVPGDVQVFHPKLPGALYHLARYDAVPQETIEYVYRKAIRQLLDRAASDANAVYDVGAQNKIFSNESFGDLLATTGMFETYHETRERIRDAKLAAIRASTKKLVRELRRRDLNDVRRDRITRVLNEVYPRLKGQLLSDELVL